jgi:hypothetical protein
MNISRRDFFQKSGVVVLAATVLLPTRNIFGQNLKTESLFPIPVESTNDALTYLRREHFEAVINSFFEFQPDEGRAFKLRLLEVENLAHSANERQGLTGEGYSLIFESSKKSKIIQGIYQVTHETLGNFSLLIVPIGLRGNRFQAIINRINI